MAKASDKLKVLENVIARVGFGGDVMSEYSKALSALNGMDSMSQMPQNLPPLPSGNAVSAPISPETGGSATQMGNAPQSMNTDMNNSI